MPILTQRKTWRRPRPANAPTRPGLTPDEQANARAALRFLRVAQKLTSGELAARIGVARCTIDRVLVDAKVDAIYAIHAARMAGVSVEAVLAGEWPPKGACPHCGR